jgi:hypothetical protein
MELGSKSTDYLIHLLNKVRFNKIALKQTNDKF